VVDYLFDKTSKDASNEYQFKVAFVQIYQDDVYDLLSMDQPVDKRTFGAGGIGQSATASKVERDSAKLQVRCAFFGRNLHSRMPLSFTPLLRLTNAILGCSLLLPGSHTKLRPKPAGAGEPYERVVHCGIV
jgi:hypothetical protein